MHVGRLPGKPELMLPAESPTLFRRVIAFIYESILLVGILLLVGALYLLVVEQMGAPRELTAKGASPVWRYGLFASMVLVSAWYFGYCWTRTGQTLALKTWRLQVRAAQGSLPSWPQALLRFGLALIGTAFFGVTYVWMLFDRDGSPLHDRLSGTELVELPKA